MPFKSLPGILRKEITWGRNILTEEDHQHLEVTDKDGNIVEIDEEDIAPSGKKNYWPIFTAGAGLFSDGYVNNSIGTASTCLSVIYGDQYTHSHALRNVSAIAFVGTVVGQLTFGVFSDYISRKTGMLVSSGGLIIFSILAAGCWGVGTEAKYGGNAGGLFAALTAYRFFLGYFIGAEYPTGSAACAEASALLPAGKRNRYFAWFTNFMIDFGFVVSAFVPMVLLWICGTKHLQPVWRITLGIGAIPPISLFILRLFFKEGKQFQKLNLKNATIPFFLIIKYYWFRLLIVSIIWWIYDFSAYAFGIYSTPILKQIIKDKDMYKTFGWNVVLNLFYLPGSFLGAISTDYIGPRLTLALGVFLQAIIGYIMAGLYPKLETEIGAFVTVYGIFLTLGEFGPGDNIGLLAAKTSATPVRGVYYGIAAAIGKIGAFVGTYAFPSFQNHYPGVEGYQVPFWLASSLAIVAGLLALFGLPAVDQEAMQREDFEFLSYLSQNGFDISTLGDGTLMSGEKHSSSAANSVEEEVVEIFDDMKKI
ncbi:hypothetical protein PICMEDRAFT_14266 [Pichia membranifaciens NRRL Y-2026]|uniref:Major facilitator superfamily (MFS) profile domain-containing protein n=1 Tax=Pichia membranifaciens NRRL Y-2026 TaxID=763406 RepID=A0A1E3NRI8_9ASCO|nr:hypothetical protein PICMEDRAFT_14266 [Pichia membranifaciens NRRL Y-2026]ODQ48737.1 hypothetical protein PICMEDRAFT_14266 [Pichia membranifaciens NRRL Y-2026]